MPLSRPTPRVRRGGSALTIHLPLSGFLLSGKHFSCFSPISYFEEVN